MTNQQRTKYYKVVSTFKDVHSKHFRDTKWLRGQLSKLLTKQSVEQTVWNLRGL